MSANPIAATVILLFSMAALAQDPQPIQIRVDFTDAPRRLFHITEQLPVHPGVNSFSYPQWIPGNEMPTGPIDNLTGLVFHTQTREGVHAGNSEDPVIPWRRDLADPYTFHVDVPGGVAMLAASFDILETPSHFHRAGAIHNSSHVVMLEPSDVVLYPAETPVHDIPITATIHLPAHWSAATALRVGTSPAPTLNPPDTTFQTVSVEQFVDSPILAGDHCRQYPLAPEIHPVHTLDVCTDKAADLNLQPAFLAHMSALVRQSTKLFMGHHYDHFDFLFAASRHLAGDSQEHTQSADYIVRSVDTTDLDNADNLGALIPHEYTHAWCGKYRRPAGIAKPEYHTPMQNDLIWVYEGLTQYYGELLTARSGFRTPAEAVESLNYDVFEVDQPGRGWRSIQETSDASAILRDNDLAWESWRLSQDYYRGGALLWLDADMKIRQLSHGTKSLDDFAALFFAPSNPGSPSRDTGPGILPYTFADLVRALNTIAPYDWENFWTTRLNALSIQKLIGGLQAAGYDYLYTETITPNEADYLKTAHIAELFHSVGFQAMSDGTIQDIWIGSPAYLAGLGPGDKLTAVNGKPYTPEAITSAVREAKTTTLPITVTATRDDESRTFAIQYHGGERYAALVRNHNPDLLITAILQPK